MSKPITTLSYPTGRRRADLAVTRVRRARARFMRRTARSTRIVSTASASSLLPAVFVNTGHIEHVSCQKSIFSTNHRVTQCAETGRRGEAVAVKRLRTRQRRYRAERTWFFMSPENDSCFQTARERARRPRRSCTRRSREFERSGAEPGFRPRALPALLRRCCALSRAIRRSSGCLAVEIDYSASVKSGTAPRRFGGVSSSHDKACSFRARQNCHKRAFHPD